MKITHVTTRVLSTLADSRLVFDRPPTTETHEFVTLELGTDEGLAGVGVTYLGGALTAALKVAVDDLVRWVASRSGFRRPPRCSARWR